MSTWVLLRGLARDSRHWESFPLRLGDALPECSRVVALDLPGNGGRQSQSSPSTVGAMVEAYRAQLRALGVGEPVNVLGLSLGAMVAVEWAVRHPAELASVVWVNGSAGGLSSPRQRMLPAAAWQLLASATTPNHLARESRIAAACTNVSDVALASRRWAAHASQARTSTVNALRQVVAAVRWRLPAERPRVPILVLASVQDRLVSVECSVAIARHWGLPMLLHATAGHEIAMDDPAWLVRQCTRWTGGVHPMATP